MTYREALAFLDSLDVLGIRPGLDRIAALLARLQDPQTSFPSVLIAGTNGKGSVVAYLASILREAGVVAGIYTSPHLIRFEERIVIDAAPIGPDELAGLAAEVRDAIEAGRRAGEETPTYFEATTALAFLHFKRRRIPIAVLEVGMGGRFDATNVVTPLCCGITPVAMDHTQWLGSTLTAIATQKAGVLKPGVPAAIGPQDREALEVIRAEAAGLGSPLTFASDCRIVPAGERLPDPPVFGLTSPSGRGYDRLALPLRGAHQVMNAATALLLAETLGRSGFASIDADAIARGLGRAVWPGRLELLRGRPDLLLDGAHNPAGCASLRAYLRDHHAGRRVALVFASMKDKPAETMLAMLAPLAASLLVTSLPLERCESAPVLLRMARAHHPNPDEAESVREALPIARRAAGPDGLVVICGSLYLIGEVKKLLLEQS